MTNAQKREWTSLSSDLFVFLTSVKAIWTTLGMSMVSIVVDKALHCISISGWGDTGGNQETSTDKLQETEVPIVESNICMEKMNQSEGVDEDLIVCAGGRGGAGPCKVRVTNHIAILSSMFNF